MLTLEHLRATRLHRVPLSHRIIEKLLDVDYAFPRRTKIAIEGLERIPLDRPCFLAMNHTDFFNYLPLQYEMVRRRMPWTAVWVKAKYYKLGFMRWWLGFCNNIPVPSRGWMLVAVFKQATGKLPNPDQYRYLKALLEGEAAEPTSDPVLEKLFAGRSPEDFARAHEERLDAMMGEVVRLCREALEDLRLHVLVFPQGTRSRRLSRGHSGLVQVAQHLGAAIIPVGCSGSDRVYPGPLPFAHGGRITYRVGEALEPESFEPFVPFSLEAGRRHGERFQEMTDEIMRRIDGLVDPEYRFSADGESDGVRGASRFI